LGKHLKSLSPGEEKGGPSSQRGRKKKTERANGAIYKEKGLENNSSKHNLSSWWFAAKNVLSPCDRFGSLLAGEGGSFLELGKGETPIKGRRDET